jgi:uncharacterized C2H2 Zn-finger protein
MKQMKQNLRIKNAFYACTPCGFITNNKTDYNRHILTRKHQNETNETLLKQKNAKNDEKNASGISFDCEKCNKQFNSRSSLWRHKKKCENSENNEVIIHTKENPIIQDNTFEIMKEQNNLLKELVMEQAKQIKELIPRIGSNNNTTNNKFNVQIFLNEKCKDAISMDAFIKSIEVSLSNLLLTKDKGLADGISNIFIENMSKLSVYERPVHCTDAKREVLYIKNDTWEKDEKKTMIKDAIQKVSKKQTQNITKFKQEYPDFMENQKNKDDFIEIVKATTESVDDKTDKVIRNICKVAQLNEKIIE